MNLCVVSESHPGDRSDGLRWYCVVVSWWDGEVVVGPSDAAGGEVDVWCAGNDFADAVANAVRFVEAKGHAVQQVTVTP